MEAWNERVEAAAKALSVDCPWLQKYFTTNGVDEKTLTSNMFDDFKQLMLSAGPPSHETWKPSPFLLKKAFDLLIGSTRVLTEELDASALLDFVDLRVPSDASRRAIAILRSKAIRAGSAKTWGSVRFVVTDDDGQIDRAATRLAMTALMAGDEDNVHGIFTAQTGTEYAVARLDDLVMDEGPKAASRLLDPLDIGSFLTSNKVSSKFGLVVDLDTDRHTLLYFALANGLRAAPRDQQEAKELLEILRRAQDVTEAAVALGNRTYVRWKAAKRAPVGTPASLPAITTTSASTPSVGGGSAERAAEFATYKLSILGKEDALRFLQFAKNDWLRRELDELGIIPKGTLKADLAAQLFAADPPLSSIFELVCFDEDGQVNQEAYESTIAATVTQALWHVFASTIAKRPR